MLRKVVRSMNLCASTDIRLTTSPTVDERLAALVITSACRTMILGGGRDNFTQHCNKIIFCGAVLYLLRKSAMHKNFVDTFL